MAFSSQVYNGMELSDDFGEIIDDKGILKIAGFGSLLSRKSAEFTFPGLKNFKAKKVKGFRRVFGHSAPIFFERGIANLKTLEISSCNTEPCENTELIVSVFEIDGTKEATEALVEREHEFRFVAAEVYDIETDQKEGFAVICCRYTDEEYKAKRCPPDEFYKRYGKHGIDRIYRNDIYPCRVYLRHCLLASQKLHECGYDNFLDTSFLGDGKTSIRQYMIKHPEILNELPPLEFVDRYSG